MTDLSHRATEGTGPGDPVVLLHGFGVDARSWGRPLLDAVGAATSLVVTPDLRGHGRSPRPHALDRDRLATDVLDLADHLGLARYSVLGYSMGSIVGVRVALRDPRVGRLVLGGMGDRVADPAWARPAELAAALRGSDATGDGARYRAFVERVGGDPLALAAVQDSLVLSTPAELATVAVPVLVVAGVDDDENGDPAALAALLPAAELVRTPGDHVTAAADPALHAAVAGFIGRV